MKVFINGKEEIITKEPVTIQDILHMKKVKMPEMVSVELNAEFLERDTFGSTVVTEGDRIEFLYFMGGGY